MRFRDYVQEENIGVMVIEQILFLLMLLYTRVFRQKCKFSSKLILFQTKLEAIMNLVPG